MEEDTIICPKCHIFFFDTNKELDDHLSDCDGMKNIICPRFYKIEEFFKIKKKENKIKIFDTKILLKRPVTR